MIKTGNLAVDGFFLQHQKEEVAFFAQILRALYGCGKCGGAVFDVVMFCKRMSYFTTEQNADHHIKLLKTNFSISIPIQHVERLHDVCLPHCCHMLHEMVELNVWGREKKSTKVIPNTEIPP